MEIKVKSGNILKEKSDAAVFAVFENGAPQGLLADADKALGGVIAQAFKSREFSGKKNEVIFFHAGKALVGGPGRVMVVGLGKKDKFRPASLMSAAASAGQTARRLGYKDISISIESVADAGVKDAASLWTQGLVLGLYTFTEFRKPDPEKKEVARATLVVQEKAGEADAKAGAQEGGIIADSVNFSRDMINTPANEMTPTVMAQGAKKVAREFGVKLKVLEEDDCYKLGMGAFLGVAKGSEQAATFIVMEYSGGKPKAAPTVIVGKGITFDSGGISLKPTEGMEKMKYDMAGAAAVIGAMRAVAALKLPVNVVALAPCTENLPSGSALKPGDVVKSMNGKTSEIISTDAEGRLVLSDALCYAAKYKPKAVIDIATLTGACVIALGDQAIGLMSNDADLTAKVKEAADATNERVWELPMWDEYLEAMKGTVTDLKNVGGRAAATVTAGKYLQEFVDYPWVHLDIAGTAWEEKGTPITPKGAKGTGVRLFVEYLKKNI